MFPQENQRQPSAKIMPLDRGRNYSANSIHKDETFQHMLTQRNHQQEYDTRYTKN